MRTWITCLQSPLWSNHNGIMVSSKRIYTTSEIRPTLTSPTPSTCSSHQKQSDVSIRHVLPLHFCVDFCIKNSNSRSINISFFLLYSFRQTESSIITATNPLLPCTTTHEHELKVCSRVFQIFSIYVLSAIFQLKSSFPSMGSVTYHPNDLSWKALIPPPHNNIKPQQLYQQEDDFLICYIILVLLTFSYSKFSIKILPPTIRFILTQPHGCGSNCDAPPWNSNNNGQQWRKRC